MRGHLARETRRLLGRFSDPGVTGNMATQHISTYLTLQLSPMSKVSHGEHGGKLQGNQEGPFGSPFPLQVEINHPQMKGQVYLLFA